MAIFKCKMCGGALEIENKTVATCEYCGTKQTLPKLDNETRSQMYDRANHFRRNNEFDKAMEIYEKILNEDGTDAEAYWSLVLCRYGIEYVEDPSSHKRIPTVNRAQFTSVFDDENYKSALQYADGYQRSVYEEEAKAINEIQKGILAISQEEEPFDVFICYKETDENGQRTHDSVHANELYHELTQEGFKVFFARITLEDKLGVAYEPYIFAALNSAKVMVVMGSKAEYFNAVWVKNEWSRYLALIKQGQKKVLIPAYKDMDPYDLPMEFAHLHAQDMNKLGFISDLVRGIKKLTDKSNIPPAPPVVGNQLYNVRLISFGNRKLECIKVVMDALGKGLADAKNLLDSGDSILARDVSLHDAEQIKNRFSRNGFDVAIEESRISTPSNVDVTNNAKIETLLKRVTLFLEGGDWDSADEYCEKVLDIDPENVQAYVGKLMAQRKIKKQEDLGKSHIELDQSNHYKMAVRFADDQMVSMLVGYNEQSHVQAALYRTYYEADRISRRCVDSEDACKEVAQLFESVGDYLDAAERAKEFYEKAEAARKNDILSKGKSKKRSDSISDYEAAIKLFESISGWKDADEEILNCQSRIERLKVMEEEARLREQAEKEQEKRKRKKRIGCLIWLFIIIVIIMTVASTSLVYGKNLVSLLWSYYTAVKTVESGDVVEGFEALMDLNGFADSTEKAQAIYHEYREKKLKSLKVGNTFYFGKYEQDNDLSNGQEYIRWEVQKVTDGKALVVSEYVLDYREYDETGGPFLKPWRSCTLRAWLNVDFLNEAFSSEEQEKILATELPSTEEIAQDRVTLLNYSQARTYYFLDHNRVCKPTAYVIAKGGSYLDRSAIGWWLRLDEAPGDFFYIVNRDGEFEETSLIDELGVRPAMWIDLNVD